MTPENNSQQGAKYTADELIAFINLKLGDAEKALRSRESMEKEWREGTDAMWKSVGCKMTKSQRLDESRTQGRIAAKIRLEVEMYRNVRAALLTRQPK